MQKFQLKRTDHGIVNSIRAITFLQHLDEKVCLFFLNKIEERVMAIKLTNFEYSLITIIEIINNQVTDMRYQRKGCMGLKSGLRVVWMQRLFSKII